MAWRWKAAGKSLVRAAGLNNPMGAVCCGSEGPSMPLHGAMVLDGIGLIVVLQCLERETCSL